MGQITYNTIFSEIQKYMLMMQWAETLIRYLKDKGYAEDLNEKRLHHEIYLSDARKVPAEKWKTVIRHPIKPV